MPFEKAVIKDAPTRDVGDHLSPDEEDELYRHYGLPTNDGTPSGYGEVQHDSRREGGLTGDRDHDGKPNALDANDHDGDRSGMSAAAGAGVGAAAGAGMGAAAGRRSRLRRHESEGMAQGSQHGQQADMGQGNQYGQQAGMSQQGVQQPTGHDQFGQQPGTGHQGGIGQQPNTGQHQYDQQPNTGHQGQHGAPGDRDLRDQMGDLRDGRGR